MQVLFIKAITFQEYRNFFFAYISLPRLANIPKKQILQPALIIGL